MSKHISQVSEHISEDVRKAADTHIGRNNQVKSARAAAAKSLEKERLAAALRENLKRRKAQTLARRDETAPK